MNNNPSGTRKVNVPIVRKDLATQEEEYKKLNNELEAKTAMLVQEAEAVLKIQAETLATPSLLDRVNRDELMLDWEGDNESSVPRNRTVSNRNADCGRQLPSSRYAVGKTGAKTLTRTKKAVGVGPTPRTDRANNGISRDEEYADDYSSDIAFHKAVSNAEKRFNNGDGYEESGYVMPAAAAEMGSEAQIRFLKANVRVMQEEIDRLSAELSSRDDQLKQHQTTVKELEDEHSKLQRKISAQQIQSDKFKKLSEEAKKRTEDVEIQLTAAKKEIETIKREHKQQLATQTGSEVRLKRALEEAEKYKAQLDKTRTVTKDSSEADRQRVDQLTADNRRLEKQRTELMTAFKKQLKLIDVLKRQKMHIEAARVLAFTEEEFIKALEWGGEAN